MGERARTLAGAVLALVVLAGCGGQARTETSRGIPADLLREARPIGRGPRFHPPVTGPVTGPCRPALGHRYGVHIELFGDNRVVILAAGIGVRPPIRVNAGRIAAARCYGSLVSIEPTGVMLVRPGTQLRLADVFRAWGQPLTAHRAASFSSARRVRVYVDGRSRAGRPQDVPLAVHSEIVIEVGPYVPPHPAYTFPPGS